MRALRTIFAAAAAASLCSGPPITAVASAPSVSVHRVPPGGIQPQTAVDDRGRVHLIYFRGDPAHGDAFYAVSADGGRTFPSSIRVNSVPGSVIAAGTVRGAQIAIGRTGRVHVAWNGSRPGDGGGTPMFYARSNSTGTAFEPQRNVMRAAYNIDGGGAVAADPSGRVYVAWHANAPGESDEGKRRVWIARSTDDGETFARERAVFDDPTGACGCCGLAALVDTRGSLFLLFRSAFQVVHRDIYLLTSRDAAQSFTGVKVDRWNVGACVMSTQAFAQGPSGLYAAWETEGQIHLARIDAGAGTVTRVAEAPGPDRTRKHPALAVNADGTVLLAWTEGTSWNKGGAAVWQPFDPSGRPMGAAGRADGVPPWGLVAAYPQADHGFQVAF